VWTSVKPNAANTPRSGYATYAKRAWPLLKQVLPKSALGQAAAYTLKYVGKLRRCFDYAEVELSNDLAEKLHASTGTGPQELAAT
jgi:hypothetical protein